MVGLVGLLLFGGLAKVFQVRGGESLQPCLGATGDDTPFHPGSYTVLDKALESRIRAAWPEYYRNMSLFLHNDAFAPEIAANQMVLLVNGEDSFPDWWVNENLP